MGGRVPGTRRQQADGWGVVERSRSRFRRDPRDRSRRSLWRFARPARRRRGAAGPDEHRRHCARGEGRVWRHRCGASGAPGGWPVQRFSPQSSLRHVCPTIVIIGHTESVKNRGEIKTLIVRISPKAVSQRHGQTALRLRSPGPTCRDPPTRGGGAEHPAARKHRALAPIRAPAARREMAGRGMETTDSQRLTVTPASPAASDALPGTPLPHAQKRARWALAGFLGPGARRARGRLAPCGSPKPTSPAWARSAGRRGGRTDRRAGRGSRYRPRSAMASASSESNREANA